MKPDVVEIIGNDSSGRQFDLPELTNCAKVSPMRPLPEPASEALTLATVLYALGDPVRLELVRRAATSPGLTCAVDGLDVPKSTLTSHWRILREAGVVRMAVDGRYRRIWLRADELEERFPNLLVAVLHLSANEPQYH